MYRQPPESREILAGERAAISIIGTVLWNGYAFEVKHWGFNSTRADGTELDIRENGAWHELVHEDGTTEPYSIGGWSIPELREIELAAQHV